MKKLILIILFIPLFSMPISYNKTSDFENRRLFDFDNNKNFSGFNWGNISTFFNDHFPFRGPLIKVYGFINYYLGHSIHPNLFIGKDGYLFLYKQNQITEKQRGILNLSQDDINFIKLSIASIMNWAQNNNVKLFFIPAPNQQTIHSDKLPIWHTKLSTQDRYNVFEKIFYDLGYQENFINLREILKSNNTDKTPTYFKLESHWTNYGKMIAANFIHNKLNINNNNKYEFNYEEYSFKEHLMTEQITNVSIQSLEYNETILFKDDYESYYLRDNLLARNNKRLLIWGDSFTLDPFSYFFINNFEVVSRISANHNILDKKVIKSNNFNYIFIIFSERNFFERDLFGPLASYLSD